MATNILELPFVTFQATTTTTGDWTDVIAFAVNGAALDVTGIDFRFEMRSATQPTSILPLVASTDNGLLINGGPAGLFFAVPFATVMSNLAPDTYSADLYATADGHTFNLCEAGGPSTITHRAGI